MTLVFILRKANKLWILKIVFQYAELTDDFTAVLDLGGNNTKVQKKCTHSPLSFMWLK